MNRRDWCKSLGLASLALTSLSVKGQTGKGTAPQLDLNDEKILDAVKRGVTMEEVAKLRDPIARNPQEAIRALKAGNSRFFSGVAQRPELSAAERRAQVLGQTPFATVLSCSDSRVPTEIVFDQSLGSLFITRVAGNIVETSTLGSIEYSINHLKTHAIVVLGHEGCGAVKAAMLPKEQRAQETQSIQAILDKIAPSVDKMPKIRDERAKMREAIIANVRTQVAALKQQPAVAKAVAANNIVVVGAYYEITSGAVDFFETEEDLRLAQHAYNNLSWRSHLA